MGIGNEWCGGGCSDRYIGHQYCGGDFSDRNAVIGYGLIIQSEIITDIFDVAQLAERHYLDGERDIQPLFNHLADQSKYLVSINTYN